MAQNALAQADAAFRAGDRAGAQAICRAILEADEAQEGAWRLLGIAAHCEGRHAAALPALRRVAAGGQASDLANLGAVLRALGRADEAEAAYRAAIRADRGCAAAQYNLGNLLAAAGRLEEAGPAYRAAIACDPGYAQAWNGLGDVLQRSGRLEAAVEAFAEAARLLPNWVEARVNLGVALLNRDRGEEAARALGEAIRLAPDHAAAHGNLGAVYVRAGLPMRAEAALRRAIGLAPQETRWRANLAVALQMQFRHAETEECCRAVLAARPDYPAAHGNLLFALNYRPDRSAEEIFAEYRAWDARHAAKLAPAEARFANDRDPERRLRVGYVSPDFRHHAVAFFAEPLLAAHDPAAVELFCYAQVAVEDAVTARFRARADHWRCIVGMGDAALVAQVRADRIDVLVDLAGHTAANRLLAFARRAAPVQVESVLGHGWGSGMSAMDGFLADAALAPPGSEHLFSETVVRIGRVPLAYAAPAGMPAVTGLPALRKGHVTFGHFGRPERFNDDVFAAWARILLAVPGARLTLNTRAMQEAAFREMVAARFAALGVEAARLELVFTAPQPATWAAYGEIDVALDPFPHNAGTTTIEALWQGVPVVSLAGRPSVGRFGASILGAVGLGDWVAADADAYVARAVAAVADPAALAELRAGLRARVAGSALGDAAGLARATEAGYRALWRRWCGEDVARLRGMYQRGEAGAAERLAGRMIARDSDAATALHVRGLLAHRAGRNAAADADLREAALRAPRHAELHSNHAVVLRVLGRLDEAEAAGRLAVRLDPGNAAAHNNLGNVLRDRGRAGESEACYRAALGIAPEFADAWSNLAWVLSLAGQPHAAEAAARKAVAIEPGHANGWNNLGLALMRQSRLAEAEAALRAALRLKPDFALPHSNILFCLNYRTDLADAAIAAEYRDWDRRHAAKLAPAVLRFGLDRTAGRRLRVGYVSPDFRHHAVAFFAEPLLAAHDRDAIALHCYAETTVPDAVTARFRDMADGFVSTVGMSDAALAERIRDDRIDVLVDLAGHTGGNRLLACARRPAPVMLETMLGLGTASGLSAMDGFIADPWLVPPEADAWFPGRVIRLDRIALAYRPPDGMPVPGAAPVLKNGFVTFGHFGRTVRLNERVVACWARILHAVPGARLVLNSAPFAEAAGRADFLARFAAHGIGGERLELVFTAPQPATWAAYGRIDVALDPFPHNAGTTTMEALWQGVPVVTLAGRPGVGRIGASLLNAAGLGEWVVADEDGYVALAVRAARAAAGLRPGLRARVAGSALTDAAGLARAMEGVFRARWQGWARA